MNGFEQVRRAFRSKYAFDVQPVWLQACINWLRDQYQLADLTSSYTLERIYHQWLHTDLTLIADTQCLPNDLDLNAKKIQLSGKYALQINSILCITEPYYTQVLNMHGDLNDNERIDTDITDTQQWKPPPPKRVLYLELTDGKIILRGLEYETINNLDRDTTLPGAKILVSGPVIFRRGMLLLTGKNTQILGGYVEDLFEKNGPMDTALHALAKTAAKLEESRIRFDRLNIKLQMQSILNGSADPSSNVRTAISTNHSASTTTTPALPSVSQNDEDDMDAFLRQAYADGMFDDDLPLPEPPSPPMTTPVIAPPASRPPVVVAPPPSRPPLRPTLSPSQPPVYSVTPPSRPSMRPAAAPSQPPMRPTPPPPSQPVVRPAPVPQANIGRTKEVIILSDEEDSSRYDWFRDELPALPSASPVRSPSPLPLPSPPPPPPTKITVSVPYTYLSIIRSQSVPTFQVYQDYTVHGCFASLVSNPRLIKNEYELQAYLNDGSDCLLVRLASDLLAQRIGITVDELLSKRQTCVTPAEKQKFQTDFNERLKQFGYRIGQVIGLITIRFFSDNRMPTVISINEI